MGKQLQTQQPDADALLEALRGFGSPGKVTLREANKQFQALIRQAEAGDESAMSSLRQVLNLAPDLWDTFGDITKATEDAQLELVAGDNLPFREGLQRHLQTMKSELAGPTCSPLERLLVERVVACWLQVQYADATYAQRCHELDMRWAEYYQRRQDRAHRRLLSACKSLATVRKLEPPLVQVNIGDKQVNIAQANVSAEQVADHPKTLGNDKTGNPA